MARVTGPLFSISAKGTIGKAFTFSTWKGIAYVREWFKPANPQTAEQQNNRKALKLLVEYWQGLSGSDQDDWNDFAKQFQYSGFNSFVKRGMLAYSDQLGSSTEPLDCSYSGTVPTETWTWNPVV